MMKLLRKTIPILLALVIFALPATAFAATTPSLGAASTFSILASSYTNTAAGTTINGDVGYTTGPAVNPTINGNTHVADATYNQAGIDSNAALAILAANACTFSFAPGAIDLATDTTHGTIGLYVPGVYCITGAASIGTAGITMNGSGTYIFRMTGAFTTAANSSVSFTGGASACNAFWTPGAATTLGANTTFGGNNIDASGITIGSTVTWTGRALAFGGTVSTSADTINTTPTCAAAATLITTSTTTAATPALPNTGLAPQAKGLSHWILPASIIAATSFLYIAYIAHRKHLGYRQK